MILSTMKEKRLIKKMEYSAGIVSKLFWFVEARETAKLLQNHTFEEIEKMAFEENIYQQNKQDRIRRVFNVIKNRLQILPERLLEEFAKTDVNSAKVILFIATIATDQLLFEFVYEVYREKLRMNDDKLEDKDFNVFFTNKTNQSSKVAGWSDSAIAKMKATYARYMYEAGLLDGTKDNKKICKVYIEPEIREALVVNNMEKYLYAMTGER